MIELASMVLLEAPRLKETLHCTSYLNSFFFFVIKFIYIVDCRMKHDSCYVIIVKNLEHNINVRDQRFFI